MLLKEYSYDIDLGTFYELFWLNRDWYLDFLQNKLLDIKIEIGEWEINTQTSDKSSFTQVRQVRSFHPSKVSFPGLPSHAESLKTQVLSYQNDHNKKQLQIKESNQFNGIPYSDYFSVHTEWMSIQDHIYDHKIHIKIYLELQFHKSTWLQSTIESNTKSELITIFDIWNTSVLEYIHKYKSKPSTIQLPPTTTTINVTTTTNTTTTTTASNTSILIHEKRSRSMSSIHDKISLSYSDTTSNIEIEEGIMSYISDQDNDINEFMEDDDEDVDEEDDMTFYDCNNLDEDNKSIISRRSSILRKNSITSTSNSLGILTRGTPPSSSSSSSIQYSSPLFRQRKENKELYIRSSRYSERSSNTNSDMRLDTNTFSDIENNNIMLNPPPFRRISTLSSGSNGSTKSRKDEEIMMMTIGVVQSPNSAHDIAVTTVETIIVFMQFTYWKLYNIYHIELSDLFDDITLSLVLKRILNSFIPGYHASVLRTPDLYGPILGIMTLPQSKDSGCSHTSLLGNSILVSICLWIGLSTLYRILAFLVAPSIKFKQCLSITGYSLFSWCCAIFFSALEEKYDYQQYIHINIPSTLPLILLGLPSAIAQGSMFWEYTPLYTVPIRFTSTTTAYSSHESLLPLNTPSHTTTTTTTAIRDHSHMNIRHTLTRDTLEYSDFQSDNNNHYPDDNNNNSIRSTTRYYSINITMLLHKVLTSLPKIIAFILVAGMHYQFLWYIARIFVPGRKQFCRLSALLKPSEYADILTQKELRKYTLMLLQGKTPS